jgi:hypothetical protein
MNRFTFGLLVGVASSACIVSALHVQETSSSRIDQYQADPRFKPPTSGFVPDEKTAVKIAEAILLPLYGEKSVARERPYTAKLKYGVWTVEGYSSIPKNRRLGGPVQVHIAQRDGQIVGFKRDD